MEKKEKIHLTILLMLFGSLMFLLYAFFMNRYSGDSSAYDSFLFMPDDRFMDFFNVNYFVRDLSPYTKDVSYPPFAVFIAYPFSIPFDYMGLGPFAIRGLFWGMMSYVLLVLSFFVSGIYLVHKLVKDTGTITSWVSTIVIITSYPVLFMLDRGNYLMVTFVLLLVFVTYYNKYRRLSLFCLSAAIALKLYPALFLILLVCDKRYKDAAQTVVAVIFLSFFPLLLFHESLFYNTTNFIANFLSFSSGYDSELRNVTWNNSLLSLIKLPILLSHRSVPSYLNSIYLIIVIAIVAIASVRLYHVKTFWKRVLIICSLMVLIPSISGDYNLVFMLIPMLLYFNGETKRNEGILFSVLFAILLVPKAYFVLLTEDGYFASIQSILNPLLLLTLFGCALIPEGMNVNKLKSIFRLKKSVIFQDI